MENIFSKVVAVLIAIVLLFIYPLYQQSIKQDNLSQLIVQGAVTELVDAVRTKGYISPSMYLEFNEKIGSTGNQFDIQMEHLHKKYNPDYADPANPNSFRNNFETYYDGHYTEEIMNVLFPNNLDPLNSERRLYKLTEGDFFKIKAVNTNRTMATVIGDILTASNTGNNAKILVPYGGMVLNEDY